MKTPFATSPDVDAQPAVAAGVEDARTSAWWGLVRRAQRAVTAVPLSTQGLKLAFRPDALVRTATDDGAHIALARYYPRGGRRYAEPVILCHGLGANRYTFDFDERFSLARRLAELGFEAWILELRGRGAAGKASLCSFDRQVDHDVTAALRTVRAAGADRVLWVGHSKGGLLALAHKGRYPDAPLSAIAALGSPTTFRAQRALKPFAHAVRPLLAAPVVPVEHLGRLALYVPPPDWFMRYLVHPENVDPEVHRRALVNVGADVSAGVGRQFLEWITTGRWLSGDGRFDYEAALGTIRVPVLLIAGEKDLLAPPDAVAHAATRLAGPVHLVVGSRANGFKEDYGHGDLILGRHAPDELYTRVARFLEAHATVV